MHITIIVLQDLRERFFLHTLNVTPSHETIWVWQMLISFYQGYEIDLVCLGLKDLTLCPIGLRLEVVFQLDLSLFITLPFFFKLKKSIKIA